jgi:hypothetical protein
MGDCDFINSSDVEESWSLLNYLDSLH